MINIDNINGIESVFKYYENKYFKVKGIYEYSFSKNKKVNLKFY